MKLCHFLTGYIYMGAWTSGVYIILFSFMSWQACGKINNDFVASLAIGKLNSRSSEFVYDPDTGRQLSELIWKNEMSTILKGNIQLALHPRVSLTADGWITPNKGTARMDDYDWLDSSNKEWTRHSWHPDTRLNRASQWDIALNGWLLQTDYYRLGVMVGYQQTCYSWTARGGYYHYGNDRDGRFPDKQRIIGYHQMYTLPYAGLAGSWRFRDADINMVIRYSNQVKGTDNDKHYLRHQTFTDEITGGTFISVSLDTGYYFTPEIRGSAGVAFDRFEKKKGTTQIRDPDGIYNQEGNVAGMSARNIIWYAGVSYIF
ncbi:omptin family outer membrane protease [Salmonella enterica]|nr:omptin family outer membrane protease [Salmonella enterica]